MLLLIKVGQSSVVHLLYHKNATAYIIMLKIGPTHFDHSSVISTPTFDSDHNMIWAEMQLKANNVSLQIHS